VDKTLRVIHVLNYFSKVRAAFSPGPETGLQIVSREMVTSSAQILRKVYASSSCSFSFVLMHRHIQRLTHRRITVQQSTVNVHNKLRKNLKLLTSGFLFECKTYNVNNFGNGTATCHCDNFFLLTRLRIFRSALI